MAKLVTMMAENRKFFLLFLEEDGSTPTLLLLNRKKFIGADILYGDLNREISITSKNFENINNKKKDRCYGQQD